MESKKFIPFWPGMAWVLYDFSTCVFSMLVISYALPLYLHDLTGKDIYMGIGMSISMLFAALFGPALGALADQTGRNASYMKWTTIISVAFTAALGLSHYALWLVFFFVIANLFYNLGVNYNNALLPELAPTQKQGWLSGMGVVANFTGSLFVMSTVPSLIQKYGYSVGFVVTAGLYLLFVLPSLPLLRNKAKTAKTTVKAALEAWRSSLKTFARLPSLGAFRDFLITRFLYAEATNTVVAFMSVYAVHQVGLSPDRIPSVMLVLIGSTIAGALLTSVLVSRIGAYRLLLSMIVLWIASLTLALLTNSVAMFFVFGSLCGVGLAGLTVADRPFLIEITPKGKESEYFGFYGLAGRVSAVFGPFLFSFISDRWGYKAGVGSLLMFFVLSLIVFFEIKVPSKAAKEA